MVKRPLRPDLALCLKRKKKKVHKVHLNRIPSRTSLINKPPSKDTNYKLR